MSKGNKKPYLLFGKDEDGVSYPTKMGSVAASRIDNGKDAGCSFCFPHGIETYNPRSKKGRKPKDKKKWAKNRNKINEYLIVEEEETEEI